jgi:hypothetical protein
VKIVVRDPAGWYWLVFDEFEGAEVTVATLLDAVVEAKFDAGVDADGMIAVRINIIDHLLLVHRRPLSLDFAPFQPQEQTPSDTI